MLLAIVIFLSTMSVGKSTYYFPSKGQPKETWGAWKKAVPQAFSTFWNGKGMDNYDSYFKKIEHPKNIRHKLGWMPLSMPNQLHYDDYVEEGTSLASKFTFNISSAEVDTDTEIQNVVEKNLEEEFTREEKKKYSGWIELALEEFAKASQNNNWLGVACVLEDGDGIPKGNYTVYCFFQARTPQVKPKEKAEKEEEEEEA